MTVHDTPSVDACRSSYRGRFAPSPTGPLHLGSLTAALASWLFARRAGGEWLVRIEDIDRPREVPGAADQQLRTLSAFGLIPDQSPLRQSERQDAYRSALDRLIAAGRVFACTCSRSELATIGGRHRHCLHALRNTTPAWRFRVEDDCRIVFEDAVFGTVAQALDREVGDFVVHRADGLYAYQLAVVVDDAEQGITDVVRGADLLDSTPRQILLQRALGYPTPSYLHIPLVLAPDGQKLGKSRSAPALDPADPLPALRSAWRLLGQAEHALASAGSVDAALTAARHEFDLQRLVAAAVSHPTPGVDRDRRPAQRHDDIRSA